MLCSSVMICPGKPTLQGQHGGGMGGDSLELSPSSIKQKGCDWMGVAHCVGLSNVFVTLSQWKRELQKVEFSQYTSFLRGLYVYKMRLELLVLKKLLILTPGGFLIVNQI